MLSMALKGCQGLEDGHLGSGPKVEAGEDPTATGPIGIGAAASGILITNLN